MTMETNPVSNKILKESFRILNEDVIQATAPPGGVVDYLFSKHILSSSQFEELTQTPNLTPTDRSRKLLSMLHESRNQRCFGELRNALASERATHWLVKRLDETCLNIIDKGVETIVV